MLKIELLSSVLLVIMGSLDCITTVIGVLYSGAKELNPFMAGIVSTNIGAFLVVKIAGTIFVAFTYILARKILMKTPNKTTRFFQYSSRALKIAYIGLFAFLLIVVANNLLILIG